jgi:hypothetical protein
MIKKNSAGDYVATCDKCKWTDQFLFYDFRRAQKFYEDQGWLILKDGRVYCPYCRQEMLDKLC